MMAGNTTKKQNNKINFGKISKTKITLLILIAFFFVATIVTNSQQSSGMPMGMPPGVAGNKTAASNAVTVSVKTMEPETIRSTVKLNGEVESQSSVNIYPDTSGKVTRIVKKLGDSVQKGDVIAYVDPSKSGSSYALNPVIATVSGTITAQPVTTGDTVTNSTLIASIGSLEDLQITIYVAEKYSNYLTPGLEALVSFTSMPNEEFSAKITSVSPVVNSTNRTIETVLELDTYDPRIKPGMFANVSLVIQQENDTFVVPKDAIKTYNTDSTLFIVDEDLTAKRLTVTTGISNDNDIQITSGLEAGMQVITAGSVTDGSSIKIAGNSTSDTDIADGIPQSDATGTQMGNTPTGGSK